MLAAVVLDRIVLPAAGGRDAGVMLWGLLSVVPAVFLGRPWRLDPRVQVGALLLPTVSFLVCLLAPTGWGGLPRAVAVTYACSAGLAVAGFATSGSRRLAVAMAVGLISLDEFAQGWLAWWGGQDPTKRMIGTFFWHNQFGAFLLPGVVIGFALVVLGEARWRKVGYVVAAICGSGVVFSTSRGALLFTALGVAGVLVQALRHHDRMRRAGRWVLALAVCAGTATFLVSPVFFGHWGSAVGALARRGTTDSLAANGISRLDFWTAGWHAFLERPWVGSGFGGFAGVSLWYSNSSSFTIYPHNDLVRAFVEGGLLAGLPELLVLGAAVVMAVRRLRQRAWTPTEEAVAVGAALAVLAGMAHALMDFDWSYPALMAQFGVLLGLLVATGPAVGHAGHPDDRTPHSPRPDRVAAPPGLRARLGTGGARAVASAVLLALLGLGVAGAHANDAEGVAQRAANSQVTSDRAGAVAVLVRAAGAPLASPAEAVRALSMGAATGTLSRTEQDQLLAVTSRLASVDPDSRMLRDQALLRLGHTASALADARALAARDALRGEAYVRDYAALLDEAGHPVLAARVAVSEALTLAAQPGTSWLTGARQALQEVPVTPETTRYVHCADAFAPILGAAPIGPVGAPAQCVGLDGGPVLP